MELADLEKIVLKIHKDLYYGNGAQSFSVQVAIIKEKAEAIEKLKMDTKAGHRAFWVAVLAFITSLVGWIVTLSRFWMGSQ